MRSGGFRNLERGVQSEKSWIATPTSGHGSVAIISMLEATLALVKRLEISKELIRECVTVPGCCCMPLLHNHLMDSYSYVRKNTMLAAKGGCICTPLTLPGSATDARLVSCPDPFRKNRERGLGMRLMRDYTVASSLPIELAANNCSLRTYLFGERLLQIRLPECCPSTHLLSL